MINLKTFYNIIKKGGVEFISGVPDTLLNDFCLGLHKNWKKKNHVIAANEGNAIALASGYHLATNTVPLVYMQNSGLGNAINPLISLTDTSVYSIPMILLIGWRGEPNSNDWPQHSNQGRLTPILLDDLGIEYSILTNDIKKIKSDFTRVVKKTKKNNKPYAFLVKKNILSKSEKSGFDNVKQKYSLSREDAIKAMVQFFPKDTIFVASTGRITRELHAIREDLGQTHNNDFLNVGAMGHTISIAAGIAAAQKNYKKKVVCIDGDGAALMHLGSLPVVANLKLKNLIHIVLNNTAHESVGGQPTVCHEKKLTDIAISSGYLSAKNCVQNIDEIKKTIHFSLHAKGPVFIEILIKKGMRKDIPILKIITNELKESFKNKINKLSK